VTSETVVKRRFLDEEIDAFKRRLLGCKDRFRKEGVQLVISSVRW